MRNSAVIELQTEQITVLFSRVDYCEGKVSEIISFIVDISRIYIRPVDYFYRFRNCVQ